MSDAGDGSDVAGGAGERRRVLVAEWRNVRSVRRLYAVLSDAGLDTAPAAAAVVQRLIDLQPQADLRAIVRATTPYERLVRATEELCRYLGDRAEPMACDVVRALHPEPPPCEKLSAYLFGRSRSHFDRAPRTLPNGRNHLPGRAPDRGLGL